MEEIKIELKKLLVLHIAFGGYCLVYQMIYRDGVAHLLSGSIKSLMGLLFVIALIYSIYQRNNIVRVLWGVFSFYACFAYLLGVFSNAMNIVNVLFFAFTWRILTCSKLGDYTRGYEQSY